MEKTLRICLLVGFFVMVASIESKASTFKPESYTAVDAKVIKLKPEEFRNKKIFYEGLYTSTQTTFPPYVEKNGIKAGKYFWLVITPTNLPVVVRKGKGLDDAIMALKRGCTVKIYGKVKKFKYKPELTTLPPYYLELAHIEVTNEPIKDIPPEGGNVLNKIRNHRKDVRNRRRLR